jgi:hypothetical protein
MAQGGAPRAQTADLREIGKFGRWRGSQPPSPDFEPPAGSGDTSGAVTTYELPEGCRGEHRAKVVAPGQLIWIPEMAREITSRCTSEVPSKMV